METVSIKLDESILKEIDGSLKKHRYSTRTEFMRDAIRDKLREMEENPLTPKEKEEISKAIDNARGILKTKTTDEDLRRVRERLGKKFLERFNSK